MKVITFLLVAFLLVNCSASPDTTYEVSLEAGDVERQGAPVSFAVDDPTASETTPVCVSAGSEQQPGQIQISDSGQPEVWWTAHIPAGASETYTLELERDCAEESFAWSSTEEYATLLSFGDKPVLEYVHPSYNPDNIDETLKPFHHVYTPDGSRHLTKGPGGLYPHHRGIFFGYNQIEVNGQELNTWGSGDGEHQSHEEIVESFAGPVFGGHTVRILWRDREGEPFIEELRTLRLFRQANGELLVDFSSRLEPLRGPVRLDGDRQHAGVHFRAAQEVADNPENTRYLRPAEWSDLPAEEEYNGDDYVDLPWNAITYPLDGQSYTVAYFSAPENPSDARFSERLYGRFGEFFPYDLTDDNPLEVNYRWWIVEGDDVEREAIDQKYQDWTIPASVRASSE